MDKDRSLTAAESDQQSAGLQHLPAVDLLLQDPAIRQLNASHAQLVAWVREAVNEFRQRLLGGWGSSRSELLAAIIARVVEQQSLDQQRHAQRVVNATGVLLHTNLGRAPLAERALARIRQAACYTNVELDLATGKRHRRGARTCQLLAELTGAEDALVVNNCAAATLLVLQTLAAGREVIVSRGQLVEIGGGFRLPEVFASAGVRLREVGTTNRTYVADYEAAINEQTGAMIRVHRSNFTQSGFVAEPGIPELCRLAKASQVPFVDDCGSGCILELSHFGIDETTVQQSLAAGSDLCLFSGDKLFGGPQAGIIVGKQTWIDRLARSPMMRAMRPDKLTLAALEATAEIHVEGQSFEEIPFYRMLAMSAQVVQSSCERLLKQVVIPKELQTDFSLQVISCQSQVGGGSLPGREIPSFAVAIYCRSPDRLAQLLREQPMPVIGRVAGNNLLLDLRTVADEETKPLAVALQAAVDLYLS